MAKRSNEPSSLGDKAKVRVFFAEVEGNNQSVQDALKTMVSAMHRTVRIASDQKANGKAVTLLPEGGAEETAEEFNEAEEEIEEIEEAQPSGGRKPRGSGKKVDRNAGLALVPDLNFRPDGKQILKEFIDEKGPKNDLEVTVATVYYMQRIMGVSKVSANHVVTAFKEVGKPIPVDLRQTIRNIKKTKMWLNFNDLDEIRTTTQGENFVEHEMGKGE